MSIFEEYGAFKTQLHNNIDVEILRPSQPTGFMSSAVSLPTLILRGRLSPLNV